jgi:hypothetical protein
LKISISFISIERVHEKLTGEPEEVITTYFEATFTQHPNRFYRLGKHIHILYFLSLLPTALQDFIGAKLWEKQYCAQ